MFDQFQLSLSYLYSRYIFCLVYLDYFVLLQLKKTHCMLTVATGRKQSAERVRSTSQDSKDKGMNYVRRQFSRSSLDEKVI